MMSKAELRKEIRRRFSETTAEERLSWSEEVCNDLFDNEALVDASTVMAFYPLPDEVNILPLLDELVEIGVRVLLPEVVSDTEMVLRPYSPETTMLDGGFGTKVSNTTVFTDYEQIDTILVPGVAFDNEGHRLGRGKGYYDRFLAQIPESAVKVAVCFPFQIVEQVPAEEHDILMDYV